jgi:predicted Zn finger-like uncharacterized protein
MHFTTRCPACGTMFRVVPDQLKISDGWVRCGHCADVFDATLYLETWVPPAPSTTGDPVSRRQRSGSSGEVTPSGLDATSNGHRPAVHSLERIETTVLREREVLAVDPSAEARLAGGVFQPHSVVAPTPALVSAENSPHTFASDRSAAPAPQRLVDESPETRVAAVPPTPDADHQTDIPGFSASTLGAVADQMPVDLGLGPAGPDGVDRAQQASQPADHPKLVEPEPSFVRQARRRAFWHSPGIRVLLSVFVLLLTLALGLQWVLHERDTLAAWQPRWAPTLKQLCAPLGCEVAPVRRIDAIVIDSSTLVRRLGNFYSFDLVLKNTASIPLAVPALELSLTDTHDAVIARRVFLPEELPGALVLLPPQDSVTIGLRLSLAVGASMPMAGYRALVFYP